MNLTNIFYLIKTFFRYSNYQQLTIQSKILTIKISCLLQEFHVKNENGFNSMTNF